MYYVYMYLYMYMHLPARARWWRLLVLRANVEKERLMSKSCVIDLTLDTDTSQSSEDSECSDVELISKATSKRFK